MEDSPRDQRLPPRMRGRLILGVPILALFAVVFAGNAAVQVHAYFEARDSIQHFTERQQEAALDPSAKRSASVYSSPSRQIPMLEAELDRITETFLLSTLATLFFGGLTFLGGRALRRQ